MKYFILLLTLVSCQSITNTTIDTEELVYSNNPLILPDTGMYKECVIYKHNSIETFHGDIPIIFTDSTIAVGKYSPYTYHGQWGGNRIFHYSNGKIHHLYNLTIIRNDGSRLVYKR